MSGQVPQNLTAARLWPASIVLTHFLLYHRSFLKGRKLFEFGAGLALPSLVALKSGIVEGVFLQELEITPLLEMQQSIFEQNGIKPIAPRFNQVPLRWGTLPIDFIREHGGKDTVSLFVASDCLYERNAFADLLATVAFMLNHHPGVPFVMCYQDRNLLYNIDEMLALWNLKCELIPLASFGFDAHYFFKHNDRTLIDDFPLESVEESLIMLEICRQEDHFAFATDTLKLDGKDITPCTI